MAIPDAQWGRSTQNKSFYVLKLKNVVVREGEQEQRVEEKVVYLYKNAHMDFELMHACFSEEVKKIEFTFN